MTCAVCHNPITKGVSWYHLRLDVNVHDACLDNSLSVLGEDIREHCMKKSEISDSLELPRQVVKFSVEDLFKVVNALRDRCGCNDCERISNAMLKQFAISKGEMV